MMRNTGISLLSIVPMRAEPSEKSEMVSQLLFGEYFTIVERTEKWLHIRSGIDDYMGWVSANMVNDMPLDFQDTDSFRVICSPYTICKVAGKSIHLPGGSLIPWTFSSSSFQLDRKTYTFCGGMAPPEPKGIVGYAMQYLGAPYLWGGKTIFGIDCSGLVQIACRMANRFLPRDASQQAQTGDEITYEKAKANDIAFFSDDNGNIIHAGILCHAKRIIHASGCVRIDHWDEQGIFSGIEKKYTHKLHSIIRL